ncbi:LuxR C-terminal-related transcriptional regulator [Isoptericola aurantiacus]|uniref:LuxR C-terminal-related transcriptional regulator n=1 Tax=Isoptericola aurantiacus TaxID=3377839 RepID=UPI00383AA501
MTSARSADPSTLLVEATGAPVAPHVAARLDRLLCSDVAALLQVGSVLTPEHLAGRATLPDPLPGAPAVLAAVAPPSARRDRHLLLCAAVAVTVRADVLLAAADADLATLAGPAVAPALELRAGRFRLRDPRVRPAVHAAADLAERTRAHTALATAARAAGEHGIALWHTALSTLAGDELLADGLTELAELLIARGDVEAAYAVAREATTHAAGERRARAFLVAGRAALWGGHLGDAGRWLRRARGSGVPSVAQPAATMMAVLGAVERGRAEPTAVGAGHGPGAALAGLVEPLARTAATSEDRHVLQAVVASLTRVDGDLRAADAVLARAAAGARPAPGGPAPWATESGAVSPLAEAHLRTAQALLLLGAGEVDRAAEVLEEAAGRLPLTCVAGGLAVEVARHLEGVHRSSTVRAAMLRVTRPCGATAAAVTAVLRDALPLDVPAVGTPAARGIDDARHDLATPGGALPPPGWSDELTSRELEVAVLVASGRANREVADELCVSVRTVEVHLGRVFRKLGVRTRSELVVRALRPAQ